MPAPLTPAPPRIVVLDTETTGLDPRASRLIDVAAVRLGPGLAREDQLSTLVDPGEPIPRAVTRLTGVSDEDVRGAPNERAVLLMLSTFVADALLVAHNAAFDREHLAAAACRAGLPPLENPWLDTLEAALLLYPDLDSHALASLAEHLRCEKPAHRALPDAEMAAELLRHLCVRACELEPAERGLLEAANWTPLARLEALDAPAEPRTSSSSGDEPPPATARPPVLDIDSAAWQADLVGNAACPPGLAARLPGFSPREGQIQLAGAVGDVLSKGGIGLFEAGTGSGKSLAYLLPAAHYSAATGRRVIVSTKTKVLQRQLAAHDLPLVAAALPDGWRWAILMGRDNYLCQRKFDAAVAAQDELLADPQRSLALAYLGGRARRGAVDLSALPYRAGLALPALAALAHELSASRTTCLGRHCPARRSCHWRLARNRAEAAHVVCVNHALLLSGRESLPSSDDVIIDEAHLLYHEATEAFTQRVDSAALGHMAVELRSRGSRSLPRRLRTLAATADAAGAIELEAAAAACERASETVPDLLRGLGDSLSALARAARSDSESSAEERRANEYDLSVWLTAALRELPAWNAFATAAALLAEHLTTLAASASGASNALPEDEAARVILLSVADEAAAAADLLGAAPEGSSAGSVVWGELKALRPARGHRGRSLDAVPWSLARAPITPAPLIRDALWERLRSAVLTSATLTVAGSFVYVRTMTGLGTGLDVSERLFPSPFDYRRQAALILEHEPRAAWDEADRTARLATYLRGLADVTRGRTLALFTNKRDMQLVAAAVDAQVTDDGPLVLAQGVHGSAAAVADEFRSHPDTMLMGVDALWTGQDFPGDTLVCLVIAKLPFPRQDPLFEARRRACEENGERWFEAFYLPEAVLKFRQGCGRLIRTETDRGVIVILDHRITKQQYGRAFLASLPEIEVVRASPAELVATVEERLTALGYRSDSRGCDT